MVELSNNYYVKAIDVEDLEGLVAKLKDLIDQNIQSVQELETWLNQEQTLFHQINEVLIGHEVDFLRETENTEKKALYRYDQSKVQPLLVKYQGELDQKFCALPFIDQLDEKMYGRMRQLRKTRVDIYREENIPLMVREQETASKYNEIMGSLMVEWEGEEKPYVFVQSLLDSLDRNVRERAYKRMAKVRCTIKPELDALMDELIGIRHQIALNAGFENYRDYSFKKMNREYSVEDCYAFHDHVEQQIIPAWNRLAKVFQNELGVEVYRPWDSSAKLLKNSPFKEVSELMDGVSEMLGKTDPDFRKYFDDMRENGLLDLEGRKGKSPGGFCTGFPVSKNAFIFANFSPSFFALIALIHEMGHAFNFYLQYQAWGSCEEEMMGAEVAELYSHGMELLLLDKLDTFYPDPDEFKKAQREELRRAFTMLIGPLSGDLFQHWMYTHPNHTALERDAKFLEISKRYIKNPEDLTGFEEVVAGSWIGTIHFFQFPFYNIEYSMSEIGALQLLEAYRKDPKQAVEAYKQGARANLNQSIADVYRETGVAFDFSELAVKRVGQFLENVIAELED